MLALVVTLGALASALMIVALPIFAFVALLFVNAATTSPQQRMMRERRRHAEDTARTMRRMTEIRRETARRMDRAEGRRRS
jgi:hypothetical protein